MLPMPGPGSPLPPLIPASGSAHPIEPNRSFDRELFPMPDRMFRLMERQQKLDGLIARARRARWVDPLEIARLNLRKQSLKERVARLLLQRQPTTH